MPLQPSNHTPEQRAAAVAASLEDGATLVSVVAAAAEGRLVHAGQLLAPFEVNVNTLKSWRVRDTARGRTVAVAAADPAAAIDLLEGRLATLAAKKVAELERRALKNITAAEIADIARACREIRSLRLPAPRRKPQGKPAAKDAEQRHADQVGQWAEDAAAA